MELRSGLGKAIVGARRMRGVTQEDFANVSSRTYLSSLERGLKSPTLDKLEDICSVLEVHPVSLLLAAYLLAEKNEHENLKNQIVQEARSIVEASK